MRSEKKFNSRQVVDFINDQNEKELNKWADLLVQDMIPIIKKIIKNNFGNKNLTLVAEDVFQESFIGLIQAVKSQRYNPVKSTITNYFKGIIKRQIIKQAGKNIILMEKEKPVEDGLMEQIKKEALIQLIEKYYPQLNQDCQDLLEQRYGKGKTLKNISEEIGITHDSIRKRSQRCIAYLKKLITHDADYKKIFE